MGLCRRSDRIGGSSGGGGGGFGRAGRPGGFVAGQFFGGNPIGGGIAIPPVIGGGVPIADKTHHAFGLAGLDLGGGGGNGGAHGLFKRFCPLAKGHVERGLRQRLGLVGGGAGGEG
ncbi:MAG: hypothetical protein FD149_482 [Rhodospirillaceae bacterium]|nr:MAG: hypothetical protein FD149_482 [Rhodospirillaceae bacterium]